MAGGLSGNMSVWGVDWFIAAVPHQIVISSVLDMLLAYWKDYNCLVDYYVIHLFLGLSLREFPMVEARMPRENSYHSILLGDALGRTFFLLFSWWLQLKSVFLRQLYD